jgi:hypothetical protein
MVADHRISPETAPLKLPQSHAIQRRKPDAWSGTERDDESCDFWRDPFRPNRIDNHFESFDLFSS